MATTARRAAAALLAALLVTACTDGSPAGGGSPSPTAASSGPAASAAATVRVRVNRGDVAAVGRVLRARLDSLGLAPAEPVVEEPFVTFAVARAATAAEVEGLGRPGRLAFRTVVDALDPAAPGPGAPRGTCASDRYRHALAEDAAGPGAVRVVACASDGSAKYVLGPAEDVGAVTSARAESHQEPVDTGRWLVTVEFADAAAWAALTGRLVGDQLAIVLDGVVQTAPTIESPIPGGTAQISGEFTEDEAKALAAVLQSGVLDAHVVVTVD